MKADSDNPIDRCAPLNVEKVDDTESAVEDNNADDKPTVSGIKRFVLAGLGIGFVVLAAVGVFLPGLPATGPLILASLCLTKASPKLEQRLVRSRFFAPFHRYLDGNATIPVKARVTAIVMMWACILISSFLLLRADRLPTWFAVLMILSGVYGTWFILRFRNGRG